MRPQSIDAGTAESHRQLGREIEGASVGRLARGDVLEMYETSFVVAFGEAGENAIGVHPAMLTCAPDTGPDND